MSKVIKREVTRILAAYRKSDKITFDQYCIAYKTTVKYLITKNINDKREIRSKVKNTLIYMLTDEIRKLNVILEQKCAANETEYKEEIQLEIDDYEMQLKLETNEDT